VYVKDRTVKRELVLFLPVLYLLFLFIAYSLGCYSIFNSVVGINACTRLTYINHPDPASPRFDPPRLFHLGFYNTREVLVYLGGGSQV
jgi:hypothetical protein